MLGLPCITPNAEYAGNSGCSSTAFSGLLLPTLGEGELEIVGPDATSDTIGKAEMVVVFEPVI